jgi:hypothetical protein
LELRLFFVFACWENALTLEPHPQFFYFFQIEISCSLPNWVQLSYICLPTYLVQVCTNGSSLLLCWGFTNFCLGWPQIMILLSPPPKWLGFFLCVGGSRVLRH